MFVIIIEGAVIASQKIRKEGSERARDKVPQGALIKNDYNIISDDDLSREMLASASPRF